MKPLETRNIQIKISSQKTKSTKVQPRMNNLELFITKINLEIYENCVEFI